MYTLSVKFYSFSQPQILFTGDRPLHRASCTAGTGSSDSRVKHVVAAPVFLVGSVKMYASVTGMFRPTGGTIFGSWIRG